MVEDFEDKVAFLERVSKIDQYIMELNEQLNEIGNRQNEFESLNGDDYDEIDIFE